VDGFKSDSDPHNGFYVSTATDLARFPRVEGRPFIEVNKTVTDRLANIHTRLTDMPDDEQELLINWGYAAADAALVAFMGITGATPPLPYPSRTLV